MMIQSNPIANCWKYKWGAYISLDMKTLSVGDRVKKNQVIAYTKNFDKMGTYCGGRNMFIAVMNYMGKSHKI